MRKACIGIIGCGHIARDVHLPNAFSNPRFRIKYCCDLSEENLAYVRTNYTPERTTSDYREVLSDPEVEGVLILTTHNIRERLIREAAEAIKHIYVEKPMSTTPEESYKIQRAVSENGVKLIVGFNRRRAPIMTDALALLRDQQTHPADCPWRYKRYGTDVRLREQDATMILMRINDDVASFKAYAFDEFVGMGTIIGELCHFFDLACYFMRADPVKIYTEGWSRTNMSVTVSFEDGSICTIFDASTGSFDHPKELIEIYHDGMAMELDHYLQLRVGGRPDFFKKNYPLKRDPYPEVTEGEGANLYINKVRARNAAVSESMQFAFPEVDKGHYSLLDGLADIILEGADSPCDALAGARATCMSLKARESARLGLPVKIARDEYDFMFDHP
ncbi:MAG: Gfo/Idh/MocA family oxidoreductase [Clostridiaceae bacterium]|nr:Gfo/Idh/MocA family oxidoreductase [Clostridiaceae bacterium]